MSSRSVLGSTALAFVAIAALPATARAVPTEPGGLTNALAAANDCLMCHSFANAKPHAADPLYAPYLGWQGTLMANAARDPVFWAGVAIADQDHPGETVDCIRCHAPRAFLDERGDATSIDDLLPEDFDAVTCELCHRMVDDGETPAGNARYTIDDVLMGPSARRRGPWGDYVAPNTPPHAWIADPYTGSSRLCGTCHDVTTPRTRVDDDGESLGVPFNEQRTYSEWQNSALSVDGDEFRSCQDCHMPALTDVPGCEQFVDVSSHPTGGRRHDLVGANRFMVALLQQEYGSAGSDEISDFYFDLAIERIDELLPTAATLEIDAPRSVHLGEGLADVAVTVTNETGHKLPSGYAEGRMMWIELVASYGEVVVWSSGLWQDGMGIRRDAQLRTYEGIAEQYATGTQLHLLLNDHWVSDTRIPPRGLVADLETDPVGDRYVQLEDGTWPHWDTAPYEFSAAQDVVDATPDDGDDDVLDLQVRLLYVINTAEYVDFLAEANVSNEAGEHVAMLFEAAGGAPPLVLAEAALAIPITGFFEPGAGSSSGGGDDTTGGGSSGDRSDEAGPASSDEGGVDATTTGAGDGDGTAADTGTDDAGASDDGGGEGCSCRTDARPGWTGTFALVLLAIRRRRRQPS